MSTNANPIRLGVIGLSTSPGGWASTLLTPLLPPSPLSAQYTITALCTSSPASASAAAAKYAALLGHPVAGYHGPTGATDLASDPNVDVVVVAVKVGEHRASVLPAIERGKDVFVEWPLGRGVREAGEIAEAARKRGVRNIVGLQGRQSPIVKKIAEVVKSGGIGRVLSSTVIGNAAKSLMYWGPIIGERSVYAASADSGASFLDIGVGHFLMGFTDALGDFTSVSATLANQYPTASVIGASGSPTGETIAQTTHHQVAFTGTLASGAVATFHFRAGLDSTKPGRTPFVWLIDGEDGSIRVESDAPNGSFLHVVHPKLFIKGEEWTAAEPLVDYVGNLGAAWREFARGDEGDYPTFEDAVRVQRVVHAIRRSSDEGRRITL